MADANCFWLMLLKTAMAEGGRSDSFSLFIATSILNTIAVDTALGLGANHITFTMAVVIGGATSFLSPVGHKANVLVFGPGGYRFFDYARVGALLTVALLTVSMIFLPLFWPLSP